MSMRIPFKRQEFIDGYYAYFYSKNKRIKISILVGERIACEPTLDLDNPNQYTKVELSVFTPDDQWASYNFLETSGIFSLLGTTGKCIGPSDEPRPNVFPLISIEKVHELYNKY